MSHLKRTCLGISSFTYPFSVGTCKQLPILHPISPIQLVQKAVERNISIVQIADNLPLENLSKTQLLELKSYAKRNGITLEIGLRGIKPQALEKYIEISQLLDAHVLRSVIDAPGFTPNIDEVNSILRNILPTLTKYDIVLGIENHDRFTSQEFAGIIEKLNNPHFGIVLDTVNSFSKEETTEQVLHNLGRFTVCFHVKDYQIIRNPYGMGLMVTGTPAGKGRLNIPMIIDILQKEAQQDFSTIIELWMDREQTEQESLLKESSWADESIAYMKKIFQFLPAV